LRHSNWRNNTTNHPQSLLNQNDFLIVFCSLFLYFAADRIPQSVVVLRRNEVSMIWDSSRMDPPSVDGCKGELNYSRAKIWRQMVGISRSNRSPFDLSQ
jgi:hypothetical protein